jgi:chaperonin GroES
MDRPLARSGPRVDGEAGDRVLTGKWSGTEVKIDDEELLVLKEDEVLCMLKQGGNER